MKHEEAQVPCSVPAPGSQPQAAAVSLGRPPRWARQAPHGAPCLMGAWEPSQASGGQAHSQLINSLPGIYSQPLIFQRRPLHCSPSSQFHRVIYGLCHLPFLYSLYLVIYLYRHIFFTNFIWSQGDENEIGMSSRAAEALAAAGHLGTPS